MRNKSNYQSRPITADTATRERILFNKGSHREKESELRFLRRILHRNPGPCPPHISNTFCVFSDGLRRSVCSVVKTPPLHCPASGRLTRSARRYGDTESGFEVGLRTASPTIRPLRGGTTVGPGAQCTRAALGAWRPNACVLGGSRSRATDSNPPPCPRTSARSVLTGRRTTIPYVREPPRPLGRAGARPLGRGCGRGRGRENSQKIQNCHLTGGGGEYCKICAFFVETRNSRLHKPILGRAVACRLDRIPKAFRPFFARGRGVHVRRGKQKQE